MANETARLLKLTTNSVEPLQFFVPRKSEVFQEDLFPDTAANVPAMSCAEWCGGMNKGPVLVSLNPAHAGKTGSREGNRDISSSQPTFVLTNRPHPLNNNRSHKGVIFGRRCRRISQGVRAPQERDATADRTRRSKRSHRRLRGETRRCGPYTLDSQPARPALGTPEKIQHRVFLVEDTNK
jgi:hypothetical protein